MALGDEHVAGTAVELQRDLVRQRRGRQEQRPLLAEERRRRSCRSLTVGSSRRCSSPTSAAAIAARMPGGRTGDRVRAEIDHGRPLCMRCQERWYVRVDDRDRHRRVGCGQGGPPLRAARGVDPWNARARRARLDADASDAGGRGPGRGGADRRPAPTTTPRRSCCERRWSRSRGTKRRRGSSACSSSRLPESGADRQLARRPARRRRPPRPRRRALARARLGERLRRCSTRPAPCSSCPHRTKPVGRDDRLQPVTGLAPSHLH